ncbi:MAG: hypothetical protein CH6_4073 [Candidatus Kapaibacterium sp.]|nr:MAG: hypothetical protein CH6_4073 [Candidatus Kapabacteria bacterium]
MKRIGVYMFVLFTFIVNQTSFSTPEAYKNVLSKTGTYEIANIAVKEIIPKFKFLLSTIPDSIWIEYETKYDSVKLSMKIEEQIQKFISSENISSYETLANELMKNYRSVDIPAFEYFQSKMDSIQLLITRLDTLENYLRNENSSKFLPFEIFIQDVDSTNNLELKIYSEESKDTILITPNNLQDLFSYLLSSFISKDSALLKNANLINREFLTNLKNSISFVDSMNKILYSMLNSDSFIKSKILFRDSLFKITLDSLDEIISESQKYLENSTKYYKLFQEYLDKSLGIWKNYFELYTKYWDELLKQKGKKDKEIEKKYQKKMKELEKKMKQLENEYRRKFKELEGTYNSSTKRNNLGKMRQNETFDTKSTITLPELKQLVENHYKFVNSLIVLKKQIEMEILKDLKEKGYIVVEVPQN